ncbi:DNA topology modulation protein FlaR [Paenibacillus anaericanus]|uniref:DNA topology modulation protein FlaR n=1 Tax=Paenibacillus anaericanus TaxID=170367 RepID=A0A3S1DSJ2_9BACL|nr:DNA topology modulation protein FlaR [Paenibacillus anaericanus]RUT44452.1 DNA topology modulation protein FlaR [Paenibacillus anaericanus]
MGLKIHIIGGAGSGKSYISERLAQQLNIPHYDLDDIFWDNTSYSYGVKADEDLRNQRFQEIVDCDSWIIEGVYLGWIKSSIERADKVFILQPNMKLQHKRVIFRFIRRKLGLEQVKMKETFKGLRELLKWNKGYNEKKLPSFIASLDQYKNKVIVTTDSEDIFKYI